MQVHNEADILKRYVYAIMQEFPQLTDGMKYARLIGVNVDKELDKALADVNRRQSLKITLMALVQELGL